MNSKILLLLCVLGFFTDCKKFDAETENFIFQGKGEIKILQASYWQYGTHTVYINNKLYALKSDNLNLYEYNNKYVTLWGDKVENYPLGGGPQYINVKKIKR